MKTIYSICVRTGFFFTFLLLATSLMAQNIQVKGLVKDPAGEAIIGASVVVKGTTNGSITDLDGLTYLREQRLPFLISVTSLKRRKYPLHPWSLF